MCDLKSMADKLRKDGYTGLYYPGECGCGIDDLAPCGECEQDGDDINDCEPGYLFTDPDNPDFWIVRSTNEVPSAEEWKKWRIENGNSV